MPKITSQAPEGVGRISAEGRVAAHIGKDYCIMIGASKASTNRLSNAGPSLDSMADSSGFIQRGMHYFRRA